MSSTLGAPRPDQAAYMLRAAAGEAGRAYKQRLLDLLEIRPGQTVLDAGCGPGTDLPHLAALAGADGTVIGVDHDPAMLDQARRRVDSLPGVELRAGDLHALPVAPGSVDRAKIDRVLMHVADPAAVLGQLHLATRPGSRIALAEPDWDTLAVDADDLDTSRDFTRYTTSDVVRNATVGRSLARLAEHAGFTVETVLTAAPVFRDFQDADHTLALGRNLHRAIDAGRIEEARGRRWFAALAEGPFFATFTLVTVIATR
ncbi:methyltransferase domain-containing protein [Kitasatospora sp. NPDC002040]|uniref:methyltransferase domain-containing protein n=1 Tax=Kitasatospora sp. NPDC002040 TaxID=3154661 RepID=UPI003328D668